MATQQQSKSHKRYGQKMKEPRFASSKEHRHRGPIGYYKKAKERGLLFTSRRAYLEYSK